jgi:hypothetical protein
MQRGIPCSVDHGVHLYRYVAFTAHKEHLSHTPEYGKEKLRYDVAPVVSGHTFRLQIFGLRIKYLIDRQALNVRKYKSGVQWRGTVEG